MRLDDIDFLIIGATKSATTWLQKSLQIDPQVAMPDPELHYFSREFDRGDDWYLAQFPENAAKPRGRREIEFIPGERRRRETDSREVAESEARGAASQSGRACVFGLLHDVSSWRDRP